MVCGLQPPAFTENYIKSIINNVKNTVSLLKNQNSIPYEFRTTVVKEYHDEEDFRLIGDVLEGADAYYLQNFVNSEFVRDKGLHSYNREELNRFADQLSKRIKTVGIRGID